MTQLNKSKIDLFDALITKWIIWIKLFDFDVKHISKKKHDAADDLFKRFFTKKNLKKTINESNIKNFIKIELNCVRIFSISIVDELFFRENEKYNQKNIEIITYLFYLKKSERMSRKKFNIFKTKIMRYKIQNDHFFRKNNKNVSLRKIIDAFENRLWIIHQLQNEIDHKKKSIYRRITN